MNNAELLAQMSRMNAQNEEVLARHRKHAPDDLEWIAQMEQTLEQGRGIESRIKATVVAK